MKWHMWKSLVVVALMLMVGVLLPRGIFASSDGQQVELEGEVEHVPTNGLYGQWMIAGVPVRVDALTRVGGRMGIPTQGRWVKVHGMPDGNGGLLARRIKVEEMKPFAKLNGLLETANSAEFTVASIRFQRNTNTIVWGPLQAGFPVEILYTVQQDGTLLASQIKVKGRDNHDDLRYPGIQVKIKGTIEAMPVGRIGTWVIAGRNVQVTTTTWLDEHKGLAQVGAWVQVEGIRQADGSILAFKIEVEHSPEHQEGHQIPIGSYTQMYGVIEALPVEGYIGTWTVSGQKVEVTPATYIETEHSSPAVGMPVEVKGYMSTNGSILADKIEVKRNSDGDGHPGGGDGGGDHGYPGNGQYVEFRGQVQDMPAGLIGNWTISGRTVRTNAQTRFEHGPFNVGDFVKVKGYRQADGSILAREIDREGSAGDDHGHPGNGQYVEFRGQVQDMPAGLIGNWTISGRTVHATNQTRFEQEHGMFQVGSWVKVEGYRLSDGSINATKIELKDHYGDDAIGLRKKLKEDSGDLH